MEAIIKSIKYDSVGVCFNMRVDALVSTFYVPIDENTARYMIQEASKKDKLHVESDGTNIIYFFI